VTSRAKSFVWIVVVYAVAGVAALVAARWLSALPLWAVVAVADAIATVVVFGFSVVLDNSSVYDPYWSVAPMAIAPALAAMGEAPLARKVVVVLLVLVWGARLTYNWARGWQGLSHEDWRYRDMRKAGRAYWIVSFVGIHLMPTVLVFLGCLTLLPSLVTGTAPLGVLDAIAFVVTVGAIALETIADEQLRAFRASGPAPGAILQTGLWSVSRHPNYLGELSLWWGLFVFALAADRGAWWAGGGALAITLLFVFVSVPLLDKRSLERRPEYAEHMKRLPALFPRLVRRR
jgi:steroid 5-alpha reductase family enzyme